MTVRSPSSPMTEAPSATSRSTSALTGPMARRSKCCRFLAVLPSGTRRNHRAAPRLHQRDLDQVLCAGAVVGEQPAQCGLTPRTGIPALAQGAEAGDHGHGSLGDAFPEGAARDLTGLGPRG
jgi:hypothetical protein